MPAPKKYPDELRERATRLAVEARRDPVGAVGAIRRIADQLGIHPEALRVWRTSREGRVAYGGAVLRVGANLAEVEARLVVGLACPRCDGSLTGAAGPVVVRPRCLSCRRMPPSPTCRVRRGPRSRYG
jgi:transposase